MGRTFLSSKVKESNPIMFTQASILATLVLSATCLVLENRKAVSSLTNCGCQCSSLTFSDTSNTVQGNCKTVDGTGAQWCYVDSSSSSCQDLVPSESFPHNPWSYQACATPEIGSIFCPVVADHVHVPVVVPAAEHVHVPVDVPAVEHVHVPVVVSAAQLVHVPVVVSSPTHVHDYGGQHNTEIPQGFNAPIPKAAGLKAPTK